jgi:hypothetical protein
MTTALSTSVIRQNQDDFWRFYGSRRGVWETIWPMIANDACGRTFLDVDGFGSRLISA